MSLSSSLLVVLIRDVLMFHRAVDPALYIRFLAGSWILVYVMIKRMHLARVKQYNVVSFYFYFARFLFFFFFLFSFFSFDEENFLSFYNWTARQRKKKQIRNFSSEKINSFSKKILILYKSCLCLQITIQVLTYSYRVYAPIHDHLSVKMPKYEIYIACVTTIYNM